MSPSPYTPARLAEAAESSRTLTEALLKLGVDPKSPSRRYIHDRMKSMSVDTSHFEREGARWTQEVLEPVVATSANMNEVLRRLGLETVGGNHTHISRRVRAFGIDTSHFSGRTADVRGRRGRRRTAEEVLVEQDPATARRVHSDRLKRLMLEGGVSNRCALCGTEPTWHGRPLPLEVDHVDGNWRNNRLENLRLLCPNCHSATDTYRGRNKGKAPLHGKRAPEAGIT